MYRLAIAAADRGRPPRRTVRLINVEVLEMNDDRPTFSSSSLVFKVSTFLWIFKKLMHSIHKYK